MKKIVLIFFLFSNLAFAKEKLHEDTIFYADKLIETIPKVSNLDKIEWFYLSDVIKGLSEHGFKAKALYIYEVMKDNYNEQDLNNEFINNSYIQDSFIAYLYYTYGFDSAYDYALKLENYSKKSAIVNLFYFSKKDKNEVKMLFLLKEHEDLFTNDTLYSTSDLLSYNAQILEILIEKNSLSSEIIFDDLTNRFFKLSVDEIRPNHEWLISVCFSLKNIDCLKQYLEKGNEFTSRMNKSEFEFNITDILVFFIKENELDLAKSYFRKYFLLEKIDKQSLQDIYKWYPKIINEVSQLTNVDVDTIELGIIVDNLIKDFKELSDEHKKGALEEINKVIFNQANKFAKGETESEKIDNLYLSLANYALRYKENELAKILAKTWVVNSNLNNKVMNEVEAKNIILFLINVELFSEANDLIANTTMRDGVKNYLLSRLAEASVINHDKNFTIQVIDKWNEVKSSEPIFEKSFFKHKDDVVVYDTRLAVDLLIYSSKSYLDNEYKKQVTTFVDDFVNKETTSSVFSWQISEIEDFLDHLLVNDMFSESIKIANWYVEKYIPEDKNKTSINTEEYKYDFLQKIFKHLLKKEDFTSAFFILEKIDPSKESFVIQEAIKKKKNKLLINASSLIKKKKQFVDYLEFFSAEEKINIISKRINKNNNYWSN